MATSTGKIQYIKDPDTNGIVLPVTHERGVVDSSGVNLQTKLAQKIGSDDIDNVVELTQTQYDALQSKDSRTMYIISDSTVPSDHVGIASFEQTTTSTQDGGTNIWTVTLTNDQTFTLAVKNGNQGNSGYTGAAGELEVVNNLTDGGSTKALSAEMGKTLEGEVSQLGLGVKANYIKHLRLDGVASPAYSTKYYADSGISADMIEVSNGDVLEWDAGGVDDYISCRFYDSSMNVDSLVWLANARPKTYTVAKATIKYIRVGFMLSGKSNAYLKVNGTLVWKPIDGIIGEKNYYPISFQYGGMSNTTGNYVENIIRVRTNELFIPNTNGGNHISVTIPSGVNIGAVIALQDDVYVKAVTDFLLTENALCFECDGTFNQIVATFAKSDNSSFTNSDLSAFSAKSIIPPEQFKGKIFAAIGDSITNGFIPRNTAGYPGTLKSFTKLTAWKLGMKYLNYGIDGSTVAYHASRNPMSVRYADMSNDADIINVLGGTNDVRNGIELGTMSDRTNTTFYGALHVLFQGLYTKYVAGVSTATGKKKKIIICTPIKLLDPDKASLSNTVANNATALYQWDAWISAVKEVAAFYSLPVLDFYNLSGINPHLDRTVVGTESGYTGNYNPYITDGTHPTQEGAEIMAGVYEGFIKSIIT